MEDHEIPDAPEFDTFGFCEPEGNYGQGLFDFDLGWTFDFLGNNNVTHAQPPDDAVNWPHVSLEERPEIVSCPNEYSHTVSLDDDGILQVFASSSETLLKASEVSEDLRRSLLDIVTSDSRSLPGTTDDHRRLLPDAQSLQYFLLLYIQFVHPRFPAMHISTFSAHKTPTIVLMAMMLAGSCHSVSNQHRFCGGFLDSCRYWLTAAREKDLKTVSTAKREALLRLILCPVRQR